MTRNAVAAVTSTLLAFVATTAIPSVALACGGSSACGGSGLAPLVGVGLLVGMGSVAVESMLKSRKG